MRCIKSDCLPSVKFYQQFQGYKQSRTMNKKGRDLEHSVWFLVFFLCCMRHELQTEQRMKFLELLAGISPHLAGIVIKHLYFIARLLQDLRDILKGAVLQILGLSTTNKANKGHPAKSILQIRTLSPIKVISLFTRKGFLSMYTRSIIHVISGHVSQ